MLDLSLLEAFLDQTSKYAFMAHLYNWGETLLHPRAAEIVAAVHRRRIYTSISSNLSVARPEALEAILEAGLDHLIVSIDGATEATYLQYRRKGNFELVLQNLRRIVAWRRKAGSRTPVIEWQFLIFRHNEHELEAARDLAREIGVDIFTVKRPTSPADWAATDGKHSSQFYGGSRFCGQLWHNIVLQSDGGVAPCCNLYTKGDDFGRFEGAQSSIQEIRTNERYVAARRLFAPATLPEQPGHPCLRCPIVHAQPHLVGRLLPQRSDGVMGVITQS